MSVLLTLISVLLFMLSAIMPIASFVLLVILIIRIIKKKRVKVLAIIFSICAGLVIPIFVLAALINPYTWCNHDREVISETPSTCSEQGEIVEYCSECDLEFISYKDKLPHDYQWSKTVEATCTKSGYVENKCTMCSLTQKTETDALGHSMKEAYRTEPTREVEGKIVSRCERCEYEEIELIDKLPPLTYIEGVDFAEIYKAYKANELRADDIYKNNRYRITAEVNGISSGGLLNLTGGATLTMMIKVDNTYVFFLAEFDKEQEENLKTINVGDTITFEGECLSAGSWTKCELIIE